MPADLQSLLIRALPDIPPQGFIIRPVGGGSINDAFQVSTKSNTSWFCKFNDSAKYPALFETEARGLALLSAAGVIRIPLTYACITLDERQVLVLEWINQSPPNTRFWPLFGEQLAALHRITGPHYGLDHNNYMGSLPQDNTPKSTWPDFFINNRLEPQIKLAAQNNLLPSTARDHFERLYRQIPTIFPPEPPTLLHGDLWSGNFLCDDQNRPVLIDPVVHYGHRNVDLAMTTLFGGFEQSFYEAYHYHYPLPANYRQQWTIANLYPLLIHLNLFGTAYWPKILHTIQGF